jgi:reactive intermediate/imine deaminase
MSFEAITSKALGPRKYHPAALSASQTTPAVLSDNSPFSTPPAAAPYSHAIKTASAIYCSGQIPADKDGNLVTGTIQEKTRQCCQNLKTVLEEAGSGIEKVVKVNVFITDMANFAVSPFLYLHSATKVGGVASDH